MHCTEGFFHAAGLRLRHIRQILVINKINIFVQKLVNRNVEYLRQGLKLYIIDEAASKLQLRNLVLAYIMPYSLKLFGQLTLRPSPFITKTGYFSAAYIITFSVVIIVPVFVHTL